MNSDILKELTAAKSKVAELETAIATELKSELAGLPAQFGFATTAAFVAAVKAASGKPRGRRAEKKVAPQKPAKRRRRAKITDAIRADVKKLVEQGKTGLAIARAVGISLPSVQNVKASLGLVRKKK